jgi:rRNA-processing protein FCF1
MARVKRHRQKAAPGLVLDNSVAMAWSFEDETNYLELAIRRNLPLATMDAELKKAARVVGVEILSSGREAEGSR